MPEASSTAATQGRLLAGRYRLTGLIASGGMAQVWLATDEVLQRQVAVKILHPHLAEDDNFVARFRSEAIAAARLRHSSIVSIYDTCSDGTLQAIVMELVRGRNLRQKLDEVGTLPPAAVIDLGAQVADALATAHRAGLVHRDVKPANILLCEDGRVMVTDFGIAKVRGDRDLTATGLLLGSVKYLAPEQVQGGPIDGRADIYALGVVLYEALCGRPPFVGETDAATALARLHDDPLLPRQVKAGIPRGLEAVIMRALARDPAQRFATAEELRAALLAAPHDARADATRALAPVPTGPPPTSGPPRAAPVARGAARPQARRPAPARRRPPPASLSGRRRNRLVPVLVVVLILLSVALAVVLFGRTDAGQDLWERTRELVGLGDDAGGSIAAADPEAIVPIASVEAYDPQGTGPPGENDHLAPLAIDGDPATAWATESYNDRTMGPKEGVGLILRLAEGAPLHELRVASPTVGWAAQVHVAPETTTDLGAWGEPLDRSEGIDGDHVFDLRGADGAGVLLWITDLGDGPPRVRAEISELLVLR